jgi:L,D-transpeptidase ErfK/SrfK
MKIIIIIITILTVFPCRASENAIGEVTYYTVRGHETLYDIARFVDLGVDEIINANKNIDPWLPKAGDVITLPTKFIIPDVPRKGIVINLATMRLYYFPPDNPDDIITFPISVGVEGRSTPLGMTKISRKRKNPEWIPPQSIRLEKPWLPGIVPAGPDNPLGEYALSLDYSKDQRWTSVVIHGTNRPWSIGTLASHGCIRLYPEDIRVLFEAVETGTAVNIIYQPYPVITGDVPE